MTTDLVQVLEGNTFVVSDERGDIEASKTDPTGLFSYDTRFLSKWVLSINDLRLNALSTDDLQYFEARFFLVPATGTVYIDPKLSVIRQRAVGDGFHEELTILSHSDEPSDLTIRVDAESDFADLFEIKDGALDVSRSDGDADCVLRAEKGAFDKVASGRTNAMAAYLRGAVTVDGEPRLLVRLQRLFPPPVGMPEVSGDRAVGKRRS